MKGLIIKDLMCLRKQRVTYIYIVVVVMIVSIMYVLSARYGNIALASTSLLTENNISEIDVKNLSALALVMAMFLPLAMVGDVTGVFAVDGKAGFPNVSAILPLSIEKRVLSKYITISIFFGIGVAIDTVIAFVLSMLTNIITFWELFSVIITAASILFIYGSVVSVFIFIFGYGKENYAQISAILSIIIVITLLSFEKAKMVILTIFTDSVEVADVNPLEVVMGVMRDKSLIVFATALAVGILSYVLSVIIAKRKRGVI